MRKVKCPLACMYTLLTLFNKDKNQFFKKKENSCLHFLISYSTPFQAETGQNWSSFHSYNLRCFTQTGNLFTVSEVEFIIASTFFLELKIKSNLPDDWCACPMPREREEPSQLPAPIKQSPQNHTENNPQPHETCQSIVDHTASAHHAANTHRPCILAVNHYHLGLAQI